MTEGMLWVLRTIFVGAKDIYFGAPWRRVDSTLWLQWDPEYDAGSLSVHLRKIYYFSLFVLHHVRLEIILSRFYFRTMNWKWLDVVPRVFTDCFIMHIDGRWKYVRVVGRCPTSLCGALESLGQAKRRQVYIICLKTYNLYWINTIMQYWNSVQIQK